MMDEFEQDGRQVGMDLGERRRWRCDPDECFEGQSELSRREIRRKRLEVISRQKLIQHQIDIP